ncbi:MAG: hypothetical protein AVDCRST_MAG86-84 [uncultured Truepera sp.]|uniref:histidine kinase n=1 Tax=uncultured Truepera sp. TaxID=543023 RepID=A0A6J4ULX7_9DEIN|nr:MAG: hypothetical protein AVDCRST_MAG86-84 [uncultured Truepera sp.]
MTDLREGWLRPPTLKLLLGAGLERLALCESGRVLEANDAFAHYFGYEAAELRGRSLTDLLTFDGDSFGLDDGLPETQEVTATLRGGKMVPAEVAFRTLTAPKRTVQLVALRDPSVQGSAQGALRRYQAELERKNRELAHANRVKSEFLATVSHELRTPLTSVVGYAQLLEDDAALSAERRDYVAQIQVSGAQLVALVEGLIDLSQLEARELVLYREQLPFGAVLSRALSKVQGSAEAKGVTVEVSGPSELTLTADPVRLEQILGSYLSNAVKFTPLGGHVTVTLTTDAAELRCEVSDDGIGISADDLPHVFQPFFRVGRLEGRAETGAGLGLALAKRLAELHGGRVWAESKPGQGSRFSFAVPRGAGWSVEQPVEGWVQPS